MKLKNKLNFCRRLIHEREKVLILGVFITA